MNWRKALAMILVAWTLPFVAVAGEDLEIQYKKAADAFHDLRDKRPDHWAGWRQTAASFYAIFESSPQHIRGQDSLFSAALSLRAAYQNGGDPADRTRAIAWFRQFVRMYPSHKLADDSLMHIAAMYGLDGRDPESAYETYLQVMTDYPRGDQVVMARQSAATFASRTLKSTRKEISEKNDAPIISVSRVQPVAFQPTDESENLARIPQNFSQPSGTATLKGVEFWAMNGWTRVVLTTDRVVTYESRELPAARGLPARFFIDLADTKPVDSLNRNQSVKDGQLRGIRMSHRQNGTTRVVFDLLTTGKVEVKNLHLPLEKKIFVDLYPPPPKPKPMAVAKPIDRSLKMALGLKVKTIVLDPGHGGKDPGAVAFGLKEKQVALDIARRLRAVFARNRPDIRVLLTRDEDFFIPLEERPEVARRMGADLFVSIHLNAHTQERFNGVETYFLNLTSDATALRVAARENASSTKQVGELNQILRNLLRDTNIVESGRLANSLQASLVTELRQKSPVRNLGVKQAPFMVLIGSDVPGVLVEAGFLTNRKENKRLRDARYLDRIAEGIYEGLRKYVDKQDVALQSPAPIVNPEKS